MTYTVAPFYTDDTHAEQPWGEPFAIGFGDLHDYQVGARTFVERMLTGGELNGGHPLGMRILGSDGQVMFTYVRPAQSQA